MQQRISPLFFDRRDHELLRIVDEVFGSGESTAHTRLLTPYLHPHGIKELTASRGLRVAYAVARLLGSLESDKAGDRLAALRALRDEVLHITPGPLRMNTGRVLVQTMKELLRSRGDRVLQLQLARDFRMAGTGHVRVIRRLLRRYHLLEMPEEWNQEAFDDHVHDVNTKGRKSATHLIMDAWIKGIRRLMVIYYNYVPQSAAWELLEAADTMGISLTIGIEFFTRFRGKQAKVVWLPRRFVDSKGFLEFLARPQVQAFMDKGRQVTAYYEAAVMKALHAFNSQGLDRLNQDFGIRLEPLREDKFRAYVAVGQCSMLHLGNYVLDLMLPRLREKVAGLRADWASAGPEERRRLEERVAEMDGLDAHDVLRRYFSGMGSFVDEGSAPELMRLTPLELVQTLQAMHPKFRIVLNLADLRAEDVVEIVFDCGGRVTSLETYNMENRQRGRDADLDRILRFQAAINSRNVVKLKKCVGSILDELPPDMEDREWRATRLEEILEDINTFNDYYRARPLGSQIGTDSTGRPGQVHGMGLVVRETLNFRGRRQLGEAGSSHAPIPVSARVLFHSTRVPEPASGSWLGWCLDRLRMVPGLHFLGYGRQVDWEVERFEPSEAARSNVYTLGGAVSSHGLTLEPPARKRVSPRYLNSRLIVAMKILLGFIPAFLTFLLTKDWWLLAYGGAFIWFAITGVRNVIQALFARGGLPPASLSHWNDMVSWNRLGDSLLFTGFSVPLLDWVVKTLVLRDGLGITVSSSPMALYTAIALANGLYLTSHNLFRGLPRVAAFANFFRTVLSIPLALAFNFAAAMLLGGVGAPGVDAILQKWAAIISKLASDCVAGAIEGLADKLQHMRMRRLDYASKLEHLNNAYAQLEVLFPREDVLELLESPKEFLDTVEYEKRDLTRIMIVNALDMLYLWMRQPRAREALRGLVEDMSPEERRVLAMSQYVLVREKEIRAMLEDGLVGRDYEGVLAFYRENRGRYLEAVQKLTGSTRNGA